MTATTSYPVLTGVVSDQRRALTIWAIAVAAVAAVYISFFPAVGGEAMQSMIDSMPEGLVDSLGYDRLGTAAGYVEATVYGLLGPILLLAFAINVGARMIAGQEEDGTLELELTAPIAHRRQYAERLAALWLDVLMLVVVLASASTILILILDLEVSFGNLVAATVGLLLLVMAFGTVAYAVGAATGRRALALGAAAGSAVVAYMLNVIGPMVDAGWMTAISPWSWYIEAGPVVNGWDIPGLVLLATLTVVAAAIGIAVFRKRDLMV
jgi:ABC-2 type transport system permease protein